MRSNPFRRLRVSPAMIVAILALVAALAGTATAAVLITSKNIKNGTIRGKDIHRRTISAGKMTKGALLTLKGNRGPVGPRGPAGARGLGLGVALVNGDGTVDETHSSPGITDANVAKINQTYCFNNLPFKPKAAVGDLDLNFGVSKFLQVSVAGAFGGSATCPGTEQAAATEVGTGGTTTAPFYIVFY